MTYNIIYSLKAEHMMSTYFSPKTIRTLFSLLNPTTREIGHFNVQSCLLIIIKYQQITFQYS